MGEIVTVAAPNAVQQQVDFHLFIVGVRHRVQPLVAANSRWRARHLLLE